MIVFNPSGGFWRAKQRVIPHCADRRGGGTLVAIEAGLPVQPVTDEDRSEYVESMPEYRPGIRREAEEVAALIPDGKPILAGMFVDDEGWLWIEKGHSERRARLRAES